MGLESVDKLYREFFPFPFQHSPVRAVQHSPVRAVHLPFSTFYDERLMRGDGSTLDLVISVTID